MSKLMHVYLSHVLIIESEVYLVDQVAKMAPQKFSTIDSTQNQNPRIVCANLGCHLCHLTLFGWGVEHVIATSSLRNVVM